MWKYTDWNGNTEELDTADDCLMFASEYLNTYSDSDQEAYIDEHYRGCSIIQMIEEESKEYGRNVLKGVPDDFGSRVIGLIQGLYTEAYDSFFKGMCDPEKPIEGQDWAFNGTVFKWVDDSEEGEE